MEEEKGPSSASSPSSSSSSSRWNPTKEQISVLEGLYGQGIRTPTAEQIQQIAGKLREYGSIEGKNVFYWFQNHKARQRQKQKQQNQLGCFTRFLHSRAAPPTLCPAPPPPPPLLPTTCTNVVCSPFCLPQYPGNIGFYPQFQKVLFLPGAVDMTPAGEFQKEIPNPEAEGYVSSLPQYGYDDDDGTGMDCNISHETLQLFPLHPTGVMEERSENSLPSTSMELESLDKEDGNHHHHTLFNFFGSQRSC